MAYTLTDGLRPAAKCYRRAIPLHLGSGSYAYYCQNEHMVMDDPVCWRRMSSYDDEYISTGVMVLGNISISQYLLVGALTAYRSLTHFSVLMRGQIPDAIELRQEDIPADGTAAPEEVVILEGENWMQLLKDYARLAAQKNHLKPIRPAANLCGYCSWYYYYDTITEEDFLENVEYMHVAAHDGTYPANVIQIDDGYQTFQGDWNDQGPTWKTPLRSSKPRHPAQRTS